MTDETTTAQSPPLIFICYARNDNRNLNTHQQWLDKLLVCLKPLERQKEAIVWCDRRVEPGQFWDSEIKQKLESARVVIAMLSPNFFASDYICEKELLLILKQVAEKKTRLLLVMLTACDIAGSRFEYPDPETGNRMVVLNDFQAVNSIDEPLMALSEHKQNEILNRTTQIVREIVTEKKSPVLLDGEPRKKTPNNLSRSTTDFFVGREEALREIHDRLQAGRAVAICAVSGMGGIGKTELALQYAIGQLKTRSDLGAVCWIDVPRGVGLEIVSFARSILELQLPELPNERELVAWCWRHFPNQEGLIVFDDVQDYQEIQAFLPPVESRFKVLLTTRNQIDEDSVSGVTIETLKPLQAYELLYLTMQDELRFVQGQIDAEELCEWLGYLPLGIKLVAKFLKVEADVSIAAMLAQLKAEKLEHDGLSKIQIVFELSWRKLSEAERQLAMILGAFGKAAIAWEWVEQSIEFCRVNAEPAEQWCLLLEPKAVRRGRRRLIELSLLQRVEAEQYQVHPLLREFFANQMTQEERRAIKTAVAMVMIDIAKRIPQTPTLEIIDAVTAAIPHLQAVAEDLRQMRSREECGIVDDDDLIWVFVGISWFYKGQGLYADAEPWHMASLEVARSLLGETHLNVATSLNNLAALYRSQGRYDQAEPLYLQALELTRSLLGDTHPNMAAIVNNLAELYRSQGRYDQAEPLYLQALELTQSLLGDTHPDVATSVNNLAELYRSQGRYDQAEPLYLQALELRRSLLGDTHPDVAASLNNLAELYRSQGRYDQAEPLYLQALELTQSLLGDTHPNVAASLNNLALLYQSQGQYDQAEPLLVQALELRRSLLGDTHPDVAISLNNLAGLYESQGQYDQAEPLYLQALQIGIQTLGEGHPNVAIRFRNLAGLYQTLERYAEAEPLYLQAIAIFYQRLGEAHPYTQSTFEAFVNLLHQVTQHDRASELSDHPMTRSILQDLQNASNE